MRQSALFTKTRRDAPSDETAKNAELLIRAGFVRKEMAGVYAYLPLGYKTLQNIIAVIREEMNAIGGEEVLLTSLQDALVWKKSGRWNDDVVDVWFKTKLKNDTELGLANTHEEALTNLMRDHIASYKDLPRAVYQFQTKFRNELRAKSGIMRSREFIMKDLYSFSKDKEEHDAFYEQASDAYTRIFERMGIGAKTYKTFASGGSFSKYSHEFQTECDAGEDIIYIDDAQGIALNKEVYDDNELLESNNIVKDSLREAKAIEVGNIFTLGTKFSDALELSYMNEAGESVPVFMGSYGIGPGRVMGTIAELLSDEKGLVWPESVAPFMYHLVSVMPHDDGVRALADDLYSELTRAGASVLYDDRDMRAGEKFAESDLLGMPWRITVGKDALAGNGFELTNRQTGEMMLITKDELVRRI
ncbi:MAG: prolyl-tRNA synthetase [Candidatus Pacebacteria bacterium]|nr:prolyl-tRNA synthetase [Candidatus Paceibacterota bacterium]